MTLMRGAALESRARELGVDIEGDPRTHSSSGHAPRASAYELQRRVLEAERGTRESRLWILAVISAIASVLSAAEAMIAVLKQCESMLSGGPSSIPDAASGEQSPQSRSRSA